MRFPDGREVLRGQRDVAASVGGPRRRAGRVRRVANSTVSVSQSRTVDRCRYSAPRAAMLRAMSRVPLRRRPPRSAGAERWRRGLHVPLPAGLGVDDGEHPDGGQLELARVGDVHGDDLVADARGRAAAAPRRRRRGSRRRRRPGCGAAGRPAGGAARPRGRVRCRARRPGAGCRRSTASDAISQLRPVRGGYVLQPLSVPATQHAEPVVRRGR